MGRPVVLALGLLLTAAACAFAQTCGDSNGLDKWTVPPGFRLQAYHDGTIGKARSLALSGKSSLKGPVITYVSAMTWDLSKPTPQVITAMVDMTGRGAADYTFAITDAATFDGAALPNGIAWYQDALYVAALKSDQWCRLYRINNVDQLALNKKVVSASDVELLRDDLPPDFMHGWKFIRFDKKGNLILPIGANSNIANMDGTNVVNAPQWLTLDAADPTKNATSQLFQKAEGYPKYRFASIYLIPPPYTGGIPGKAGNPPVHIAEGVRNTVGFDFHPRNGLYFTDNGRDNIGGADQSITDNSPDCEVNFFGPTTGKIAGTKHFGYPHCHTGAVGGPTATPYTRAPGVGTPIPDPNTNQGQAKMQCSATTGKTPAYTPALQAAGPHAAPLGMRFINWKSKFNFPKSYKDSALVALHGSWNRDPTSAGAMGARVMSLKLSGKDQSADWQSFLAGGLPGDKGDPNGPSPKPDPKAPWIGRPVDLEQLPDGSFLVSDDFGGRVFRVAYCAGKAYGSSANYGVGRCAGVPRPDTDNTVSVKLPAQAAGIAPCKVRVSDDAAVAPVEYAHCQTTDLTSRGTWATLAWSYKSVPGDANKVRLSTALVLDDFEAVVGKGWLAHGLPDAGSNRFAMAGSVMVISKQSSFSAATISDQLLGQPGSGCHATSCFTATAEGTFFDKANTLRASMAGSALVQRAEFVVGKDTLKKWGSKALVMLALGDTDANTGAMRQHWLIPTFKLPYADSEVDAAITGADRVANPRVVTPPSGSKPTDPYPTPAAGCTVDGVAYTYCADLPIGSLTVSHYYKVSGGVVSAAIKAKPSGGSWVAWLYNADAPGSMIGANANAAFILGDGGSIAPLTIARKPSSYGSPGNWATSTFFSNAVPKALPGGELLLTFSFTYPAGQTSIMVNHGTGSWSTSTAGSANPATGMSQHGIIPPKLCLRASGQIAPLNACNTCD